MFTGTCAPYFSKTLIYSIFTVLRYLFTHESPDDRAFENEPRSIQPSLNHCVFGNRLAYFLSIAFIAIPARAFAKKNVKPKNRTIGTKILGNMSSPLKTLSLPRPQKSGTQSNVANSKSATIGRSNVFPRAISLILY